MIQLFPDRTIALTAFGYDIRWYGVMYVAAFWIAYFLIPRLALIRGIKISTDDRTALVAWAALGVIVGGRMGYVLFYEPNYFLSHPLEIFSIWNGGMSSHGGFIGVAVALFLCARKRGIPVLACLDVVTVPAALGLMLGRIGNFINRELGGTRYPVQLIDAACMGVLAVLCYALVRKFPAKQGVVMAFFLVFYSISRFLLEYLRYQEWSYTFGMTRGQILTIPVFLAGVLLWRYAHKH